MTFSCSIAAVLALFSLAGCSGYSSNGTVNGGGPIAPYINTQPANQTVAAGQTATFTIRLPNCFYQVDLVCGPPIVNLTGPLYGDLKLDSGYGGTEACR